MNFILNLHLKSAKYEASRRPHICKDKDSRMKVTKHFAALERRRMSRDYGTSCSVVDWRRRKLQLKHT